MSLLLVRLFVHLVRNCQPDGCKGHLKQHFIPVHDRQNAIHMQLGVMCACARPFLVSSWQLLARSTGVVATCACSSKPSCLNICADCCCMPQGLPPLWHTAHLLHMRRMKDCAHSPILHEVPSQAFETEVYQPLCCKQQRVHDTACSYC